MLAGGVVHGMKTRDRTADASHPEFKEHADGLRRRAHYIVNQIVKSDLHPRLRSPGDGNATRLRDSLSRRNLQRVCLDRPAVELLRTIEVRVERRGHAAKEKSRVVRYDQ